MADTLDLTGLARPATPPVIPAPDPIDVALDAFLASNPRAKEFGFGPKPPPVDLTDLAKPARSPKGDLPKAASVDLTGLAKPATKPISGNLFTEAAHGFEGSALGGNAQLTGNAAEGFGVLTDSQLLQDTGKKISAFGAASQQGLEAQVPSFTDIRTDSLGNFLGDVGRYGGYQVGSMVGSSIPPLVAGLGATAVTENPAVGLFAGAFGPSYIQNFGDLYGSVRDDKDIQSLVAKGQITQKGVAGTAALAAVPMAALDSFGLERMLGKTAFSSVKQDLMRRIVKGVGTGAIYEGSTEGLQQIVQEWAQDHLGSQKSLHDSVVSVIDNALAGALGGGVMGGVGGAFGGVGRVDEQQPPPNTPPPRAPLNGQIIPPETPPPGSPQVGERPTIDLKVNQPPPAEPAVNLPSVPDWPTTEKPVATSHPPLRIELNLGERDKLMGDQPADLTGLARPALPPPESASNPASASSAQNVQNPEITQKTGVPTVETPKNGVESPVIALPDLSGLARPVRGAGVQQSPAHALAEGDVARADAHVAPEPSEAQIAAGNAPKGHLRWNGLRISIETAKGGARRGTEPDGTPWEVPNMPVSYGYVRNSRARDGDHVDVFFGPEPQAPQVFVLDQIDPETGRYNEAKSLIGFPSQEDALRAYHGSFSDGRAGERIGAVSAMSVPDFKKWLKSGRTGMPFNAKAVAAVREARQQIAKNLKSPEEGLPKSPILNTLIKEGGVDPSSPLAGELRHMGITKMPGLFRRGGTGALDNWVLSEHTEFGPEANDGNGYIRQDALLDAIREEHFDRPLRPAEVRQEMADHAAANPLGQADEVALDAVLREYGQAGDDHIRTLARQLMADGEDADSAVERAIISAVKEDTTDEEFSTAIPFLDEAAVDRQRGAGGGALVRPTGEEGGAGAEAGALAQREAYGGTGEGQGKAFDLSDIARPAIQETPHAEGIHGHPGLAGSEGDALRQGPEHRSGGVQQAPSGPAAEQQAGYGARAAVAASAEEKAPQEVRQPPAKNLAEPVYSKGKRAQEAEYYRRMQEKDRSTDIGPEGREQNVLPGAEREANARFLQRKAEAPLKPKAEQKPADQGLFGDGHKQKELFSTGTARTTARDNALAIIQQVAGEDVVVNFAEKIVVPKGHVGMAKWGALASDEAAGSANKIDRLINISLNPEFETNNTAYHEAYHLIEDLKTKQERALFRRELPRLRALAAADMGMSRVEAEKVAPSEIEAQAFAAYAQGREKGIHIGIRAFFAKLLKIIRRIRNMMQGLGYRTSEDFYDAALRSEVQARGLEGESTGEQFSPGKRSEPIFFSAVVRSVESAKLTKATPDQWMGYLRNQPGVKAEELSWLGVEDWLAGQKSVSKEALADFVRANQVEVREVEKSAPGRGASDMVIRMLAEDLAGQNGDTWDSLGPNGRQRYWDQAARRLDNGGTKFASYQLPGGENYRELLLTLPVKRAVGEIPPFEEWLQSQPWINSEQGRLMAEGNKRLLYEQWVKREEQGKNSPDTFRSSHWDEPNVLAHVRFNEREVNGKRVLFIEEIQSDWHQRGRKAGYNTPAASEARQKAVSEAAKIVEERRSEEAAILDNAVNFVSIHVPEAVQVWTKNGRSKADRENVLQALRIVQSGQVKDDLNGSTRRIVDRGLMHQALAFAEEIEAAQGASRRADFALTQAKSAAGEVPDAPFKTTWPELSLKRMVRYAAENGFDSLAWTPGAVQAERYDLSKQVSELHYFRGADRRYTIDAKLQGQSGNTRLAEGVEEKQLPDYVGKELADKIANNEAKESVYSGLDLKVGGEGMIGFYDRMLPSIANKLGKKFGAKVGETRIPVGNADMTDAEKVRLINEHGVSTPAFERARPKKQEAVHSLPITDSMRESVMSGQALFSRGKRVRRDPTAFFDTPEDRRFLHRFLLRSSFGMLRNGMFNQSLFRRRFQDRARIIQDMQDAIEAAGGPISDDTNLYQTESLYYGKAGEGEFHLRTRYVEPLVRKMNGFGIDRTDLDEFIYALHAHERNAKIRQINPAIADPSGMSDAEARAILQRRMTGNQAQHYLELADDVQKIVRWTRDRLFNAGLISQQVYDEWSNAYANYVPLRGWEADPAEEERVRAGQGFDLRAAEAYAALGRHSRADSPLAYVILQAKQAVLRAEKNKVALTLGRVAKDFKNRQVWEVNRAETKRRISPVTGLVEDYYVAPPAVARMDPEHVIVAKSRGKAVYITIHDERLLKAMRMKGADELGAFLRQLSRGTRLLARLYTAYDPDYLLRNLSRDTQTALFHLSEQQIKGLRLAVLRDWAAATTGMYRYLRGDQSNSHTWLRYARDFAEAGGKVSFFNMESLDEEKRRLDSALNRRSWIGELQRGRPDRAGLEIARAIEGIISDSNGAIENAIRLSVFVNLRRHGVSPSQAASVARELTVNFNRKGEWSPAINSAYIFFNAGAQGVVRVMQFAKRHPKAFVKIAISLAALGAGSDWWNYLIAGEDPKDGMNFWDKVPEYDKQRNFIIMEHGTGKYLVRIPMTYIYNVFEVFGGAVSAVTRNRAGAGRGMEPLDAAIHVLTSAINAYSPLEMGSSLLEAVSPTVIDPLVQIARNKDWKNSPVAPEKQDERDRNADLYFRGVNPVWKQFADWMERGTKIDERKPAIVDLSPEWMEHIFNTFFGGAGQFWVDRIGGNILKAIEGEPIETKDIPFVRTFRGEVNDYVNQNIYYGLRDDVLRIYDLSLVAPDRAAKYPVELAAAGDFLASEKILSKLRRARKEIDKDPNISSKDRATAVDEIQAEMTTTMDNARAAWEAARKRINGVAPAP